MTQEGKNKAFKIVDISTYLNTNKYFLKMILGKVHACGEGTNGRLGLSHSSNVSAPRQMSALSQYVVKKVAVHSGGKHAMALTVDGKVFSWVSEFLRFFLYYFEIFTNYRLMKNFRLFGVTWSSSSKTLVYLLT